MNNTYTKRDFLWCCGIEDTFINDPHPETRRRLDEYELTGHYNGWKHDLDLISTLGVNSLRWGIPWYKINPSRRSWDWSWVDDVMAYATEEKHIDIILDLMHYGTPDWLEDSFLHPDYPEIVTDYTARVIDRYKDSLNYVVPFNEPHTAAEFCGRLGQWPPYANGYEGYFSVYKQIIRGAQLQTELLQANGLICVQVECAGGSLTDDTELSARADLETVVQSMYFSFLTGKLENLEHWFPLFREYGLTSRDIDAFQSRSRPIDILGINYYPQFSFKKIDKNGGRADHLLWTDMLQDIIEERYNQFSSPIMITETSVRDDQTLSLSWLRDSVGLVKRLISEGLPIAGYTWFPVIDMIDWEYRVGSRNMEDYIAEFGMWDLGRSPRAVGEVYRNIIEGKV